MSNAFLANRVSCFLLLLMIIVYELVPQLAAAAVVNSSYSTSFSTHETDKFWSSTPSGNYILGFRKINNQNGSFARYLLSTWHTNDSVNQTALWWADFGGSAEPVVAEGATLNHSATTGMLELYDPSSTLQWSSGNSKSSAAAATRIEFLDSGNLRLLDTNHNDSISWESFQHLTNVLMLGGLSADVIQNKPYLLRSRKNGSSYAAGKYHMGTDERFEIDLYGIDQLGNQYKYMNSEENSVTLNISSEGKVSVGPQTVDGLAYETSEPELDMLSLDVDGQMRVYRWFSSNFSWSQVWELESLRPIQCRIGNPCGPFGICTVNDDQITVHCSCLTGYHAISGQDPSQGCARDITLPACGARNSNSTYSVTMHGEIGKDYYYNDFTLYTNISNIDDCKTICLNECACIVASYTISSCYLKGNTTTNYLVSGLTSSGTGITLLVKLAVPVDIQTGKQGSKKRVIIAVVASVLAVVLVAILGIWAALCVVWRGRRARLMSKAPGHRHGHGVDGVYKDVRKPAAADRGTDVAPGPARFTYKELVQATRSFSHPLGKGGINGVVYKGWIKHKKKQQSINNEEVAVKIIEIQSSSAAAADEEEEQLEADVGTMSKTHHINLVRLVGFCIRKKKQKKMSSTELLLAYEYMAKGSLDTYLELSSSSSPTTTTVVEAAGADDDDHEKDDMQQVEFQQRGRAPLHLPWPTRYSIALGAARGIAYLHHDCNPPIFHSNLKPHNILLDSQFTPKVTDFGLASCRRPDNSTRHDGYAAPECRDLNQKMTTAADVYSFGMVLLELIRGSIGHDYSSLLEWAIGSSSADSFSPNPSRSGSGRAAGVGNTSSGEPEEEEDDDDNEQKLALLKLALLCVQALPEERPTMARVVQEMELVDKEQRAAVHMEDPPNPAIADRWMAIAQEDDTTEVANLSCSLLSAR